MKTLAKAISPALHEDPEFAAIMEALTLNMPTTHNEIIAPTQANALLKEMRHHNIQRKLDRDHVNRLRSGQAKKQSLRDTTLYIAHWKNGQGQNCKCLIDGQHRMECIATGQAPERFVVINEFFNTKAEVRERFNVFDKGKHRGKAAMIESYELPEEIGLPQNTLSKIYAGVRLINCGFDRWREREMAVDHDIMVPSLRNWKSESLAYCSIIKGTKYGKFMLGGPVIAVMLAWLRADSDTATDFITRVATGKDGDGTPTRALINLLTKQNISAEILKQIQRPMTKCRLIAEAVTAFQRGNDLEKILPLTVAQESTPILIMGTQYDGVHLFVIDDENPPTLIKQNYVPRKRTGSK